MKNEIHFCFIKEYPSLKEGIFDLIDVSKSHLKKANISKKYLEKPIRIKDEVSLPINIVNNRKINPIYTGPIPDLVFENEDFIVFSKPHQIHSHPLSYNESDNFLSYLLTKDSSLLSVNTENYDRGLIYRLDYETSGLLYYTKKESIYKELRSSFNSLMKEKKYYAIVEGKVEVSSATHFLMTSDKKGSVVKEDSRGKKCTIEIEVISYNLELNQSLILVNLHEGFKHQIRAQLSILGHSIIGDPLYSDKKSTRMWLHCYQYCFVYDSVKYDVKDDTKNLKSFFTNFHC